MYVLEVVFERRYGDKPLDASTDTPLYEIQTWVIESTDALAAQEAVRKTATRREVSYKNQDGEEVNWLLYSVLEPKLILSSSDLQIGAEVASSLADEPTPV